MTQIDITGISKAKLLAALYNASKPQGLGFIQYDAAPMTEAEAEKLVGQRYFDYLQGRVMKVDIGEDTLDGRLYDRDNGQGAAQRVVNELRATDDVNSEVIEHTHLENTRNQALNLKAQLADESPREDTMLRDGMLTFSLDIRDFSDDLADLLDAFDEDDK